MGQIRFSIFLPVRNGFPYVQRCVESILSQTYPHFELHVLDNMSNDQTVPWLTTIKDPRVHLYKSSRSLSIQDSWARIKDATKEEYMTFLGHDDFFNSDFLETAKNLIERNPGASLYQLGFRFINAKDKTISCCRPIPERETAAHYLETRLKYERDAVGTGFIMRSKDYDRLGGIPGFERLLFADDALWLMLSRLSWKAADSRETFAVRIHAQSESALPDWRATLKGLDQFADFLDSFNKEDKDSHEVYCKFGSAFWLNYHRYVYICAIMEACHNKIKIDPLIFEQIKESLAKKAPETVNDLSRSFKVRVLQFLNKSWLRFQVDYLWKLYYFFRTKSL